VRWLVGSILVLAAAILGVMGILTIWWYVVVVVIGQAGDPDRSMVFWGLPILFLGIFAAGGAVGLAVLVWRRTIR
jgi:hypothetical protein